MAKTLTIRLSAEGLAERLERVGDLRSKNDPSEVIALTQQASKWLVGHPQLARAFNRLSIAQVNLRDYPKSDKTWNAAIAAAERMAAAFRKLRGEYIELCDVNRHDDRKCTAVIRPGDHHCPDERFHKRQL